MAPRLPRFDPSTRIRALGDGEPDFTINDATCHLAAFGVTGSGKTSATAKWGSLGYMGSDAQMGMLYLCSKITEPQQYVDWANEVGRGGDVRLFDASGDRFRFNFLDWLSGLSEDGAGLTINVVAFLEEIITALNPERSGGSGDNVFWEDELHHLLVALVMLVQLAGYELSLPTMRDIVRSAPLSREQVLDPKWREVSANWFFLEKARERCESLDAETQADYAECRAYFTDDFANLSEKTRSIITLMFTKLAQPFSMQAVAQAVLHRYNNSSRRHLRRRAGDCGAADAGIPPRRRHCGTRLEGRLAGGGDASQTGTQGRISSVRYVVSPTRLRSTSLAVATWPSLRWRGRAQDVCFTSGRTSASSENA